MLEFFERPRLESRIERLRARLGSYIAPAKKDEFEDLQDALAAYFSGRPMQPSILAPEGSTFQLEVWAQLRYLRDGETTTYTDLAKRLGRPAAHRAVASANAANPIAILIPCHRVIGLDGKLRGYAGGLWRKEHLLELEDRRSPPN